MNDPLDLPHPLKKKKSGRNYQKKEWGKNISWGSRKIIHQQNQNTEGSFEILMVMATGNMARWPFCATFLHSIGKKKLLFEPSSHSVTHIHISSSNLQPQRNFCYSLTSGRGSHIEFSKNKSKILFSTNYKFKLNT